VVAGVLLAAAVVSWRRDAIDERLRIEPARSDGVGFHLGVRPPAVAGAIAVAAVAGPIAGATAIGAMLVAGWTIRRRRVARDVRLRADEIPDAAAALAAGLRAGLSLPQAIAFARDESVGPMRHDLERLASSIELGTPVGDALLGWGDEVASDDARLLAGVVDLHRRTGGDLPSVLDGVVTTLRDRLAAEREVRALTAQARLSGTILGALPIGFFAFLVLTSRHDMLAAMSTPLGRIAVAVGLTLELLAFAWIRRLLAVR
jgi:tight adherence protein B